MIENRGPAISPKSYRSLLPIFVAAMLGVHAFFFWSLRGRIEKGDPDFTVYYTAGKILREGRGAQLYDLRTQYQTQREFAKDWDIRQGPLPYIHTPVEALVFLPLTWLPYSEAFLVWDLLCLGMLAGTAHLLRRSLVSIPRIPVWKLVVLFLAFFPIFINFLQGQDAILLLLLCALGFNALKRNEDYLAGAWLGFGIFKYHFMVPLVLILILAGRRRLAFSFAAVASVMALISISLVGWQGALHYPAFALHVVSVPGRGQTPYGLMPNLLGLVSGWPGLDAVGWPLRLMVLVVSAVLILIVGLMARQGNDQFFNLTFALAVITTVLVSYNANAHDLCMLILPLALVADYLGSSLSQWREKRRLIVPALPLLLSPFWIALWLGPGKINLMVALSLWWGWEIRREILGGQGVGISQEVRVPT